MGLCERQWYRQLPEGAGKSSPLSGLNEKGSENDYLYVIDISKDSSMT
jgi:hypothetical protein